MEVVRKDDEIQDVFNRAYEQVDENKTKFHNMTYEQGVVAMYEWLVGDGGEDGDPMD